MPRVTYRYLTYLCQDGLKQVQPDSQINPQHIIFWVKMAVNKVKNAWEKTGIRSGSYLVAFTDVPLEIQSNNSNNTFKNRKYLELPNSVLDLDLDRAIDYISYDTLYENEQCPTMFFQRSTLQQIRLMYDSPHEKPGKYDNYYFVRMNNVLYLYGIEDLPVKKVNLGLRTAENPYIKDLDWDTEIIINDEQLLEIYQSVLAIGRYVLLIPQDRTIDGTNQLNVPTYKTMANPQTQQAQIVPQQQNTDTNAD